MGSRRAPASVHAVDASTTVVGSAVQAAASGPSLPVGRRIACRPPPPQPHRSVPADLVGRCFNCLQSGHVAAVCTKAARCLHCHREGHQAHGCKRPRSPTASGLPQRPHKVASRVIIHPSRNDFALAKSSPHPGGSATPSRQGSATPLGMELAPTPNGSPLLHMFPLPPHGSPHQIHGLLSRRGRRLAHRRLLTSCVLVASSSS
jgi:hypothetical protein